MAEPAPDDFIAWVRGAQGPLLRSAFLVSGSEHQAQDLLQEALIKVAHRWPRLRDGNPTAYARRIILRDQISWWRRKREHPTDQAPYDDGGGHDDDALPHRLVVAGALQALPPRQRAVIVLRYLDDLTERETADVLGISVGTVKSQVHDALRSLRGHDDLAGLIGKEPR